MGGLFHFLAALGNVVQCRGISEHAGGFLKKESTAPRFQCAL